MDDLNEIQQAPLILVVDMETSGLDAERHGVIQIGATWLLNGEGEFSTDVRLREGAEWDLDAERVHGVSQSTARDPSRPTEAQALDRFLAWLPPHRPIILAGLTPSYDRAFTRSMMKRRGLSGFSRIFPHRVIDLHSLVVGYAMERGLPIPERGFCTDDIYELLGLPPEPRPHVAITGARKEAEALRLLLRIPQLSDPVPFELVEGQE